TLLSYAIENRHEAVIKLLLKKGTKLESKDNNSRTLLLYTIRNRYEVVIKLLLKKGTKLESKDNYYN
ncbi:hypothetical protein GQ44DRAFT_627087, partial [Phaeosphaeriaceae sp. PMI808]